MALQMNLRKQISNFIAQNRYICLSQYNAKQPKLKKLQKPQVAGTVKAVGASIAAKGFLRPHKSYEPPANVPEKIQALCSELQINSNAERSFVDLEQKFKLLAACYESFQHCVPNSQVHEMQTVADIISFYETAVDTTVPYEALKKMELPENLHIQYEYLRFNPETDEKFGGQTAFPKSSTLVTGLKYRGKYAGHIAKQSWP